MSVTGGGGSIHDSIKSRKRQQKRADTQKQQNKQKRKQTKKKKQKQKTKNKQTKKKPSPPKKKNKKTDLVSDFCRRPYLYNAKYGALA